jgi:radical SAM protein with 4Fe4S-binding SPASM domain
VIDQARELGCHHVHFTGGEPLLRDDITDLSKYVIDRGLSLRLQTNGELFGESVARSLRSVGVGDVMFSLDSCDPSVVTDLRGLNSSHSVARAVDVALSLGFHVRVNAVITSLNATSLIETARQVIGWGVGTFSAFYFSPIGRGRNRLDLWVEPEAYIAHWRIWSDQLRDMRESTVAADIIVEKGYATWDEAGNIVTDHFTGCGGGCQHVYRDRDYLIVRSDGAVYPCILLVDAEPLGNVLTSSLEAIWARSPGWEIMARRREGACASCDHWTVCGGGCAGYARVLDGDSRKADVRCRYGKLVPLCPIMKYNFRRSKLGGSSEDVTS